MARFKNDERIHKAPAIVGCRTLWALGMKMGNERASVRVQVAAVPERVKPQ